MKYKFVNMNAEYSDIIHTWKYDGEYSIYNYENDKCISDPCNWDNIFAVLDENGELTAEVTFYNNNLPDGLEDPFREVDMFYGQGMRPDLTGKGYGPELISQSLDFGINKFNYDREYVLLDVLTFNKRAFKAYEKCGFEPFGERREEFEGRIYEFVCMRYKNPKSK